MPFPRYHWYRCSLDNSIRMFVIGGTGSDEQGFGNSCGYTGKGTAGKGRGKNVWTCAKPLPSVWVMGYLHSSSMGRVSKSIHEYTKLTNLTIVFPLNHHHPRQPLTSAPSPPPTIMSHNHRSTTLMTTAHINNNDSMATLCTRQMKDDKGRPWPGTLMDVPHRPDSDPCCRHWPHYSKWAAYLPNPSPFFTQEAGVTITNVATNNGRVMTWHINRHATSFRWWHMSSLLSSLLQVSSPHFCFHVRCRGPHCVGNMATIQHRTSNKWRQPHNDDNHCCCCCSESSPSHLFPPPPN